MIKTLRDYTFGGKGVAMNLQPQWIVGFVDGEGCFYVGIFKRKDMTVGCQVQSEFVVVQHEKNIQILYALKKFFGCGKVCPNHGSRKCFKVRKKEDLLTKILPFFEQHSLKTTKNIDFLKFRDVLLLQAKNEDLTFEGIAKITKIKNTMNTRGEQLSEPKIESSST
uniref:Homing endonuclease LAGLIDADG domain-containing protein n=1 Tax=Trebouxia angustilobata TaxID=664442 RepID=C7AZ00_9CHLO|nr:hypothetical protein [Trebouxia angustilobata]